MLRAAEIEAQAAIDAEKAKNEKAKQEKDPRKEPDFIDFTMPAPKKITLPKVEIQKPKGPLPFQVTIDFLGFVTIF